MNPAPIMPTRIGSPAFARSSSARSTRITRSPREVRPAPVLVREQRVLEVRPLDPEGRVVPPDAALGLGRVVLGDQVEGFGFRFQRLIAVREPLRYIEGPPVVGRELDADPALEGRRASA